MNIPFEKIAALAVEQGVEEHEAGSLFETLVPLMSHQLGKNMSTEKDQIERAVREHVTSTDKASTELALDGQKILGHIFKGNSESLQQKLASDSSIDTDSAGKLIQEFAPLVLGMLGGEDQKQEGLEKILQKTTEKALGGGDGAVSVILKYLDFDKDGSFTDDIPTIFKYLRGLGSFFGKK